MAATQRYYSPQLDGLRFCAALAVFVHHAPSIPGLGTIREYGWLGVDLFLSISAFLITRLLLLEYELTGAISLRSFYIRRALRIWPLYLGFATAACLISIGRVPLPTIAAWWLSHLTFSNNLLTAARGYSPVLYSAHLWTISLEEQAYLVVPLAVLAFARSGWAPRQARMFALVTILVLIASRTAFYLTAVPHPFVWVLPLRGDAFLLGAVSAVFVHHGLKPRWWWLPAGLALTCCATIFNPPPSLYTVFGYTIAAAGCTAMVAGSQAPMFARSPLAWAPMRYLGKISYGFYVFHIAALVIAGKAVGLVGAPAWIAFPAGLGLTIASAALSYAVYEKPFLRLKERFEQVKARPV